jgi:hypothetical protein
MHENFEYERLAYYKTVDFSLTSDTGLVKDIIFLSVKYKDSLLINNYTSFASDTNDIVYVFYGAILLNLNKLKKKLFEELSNKNLSKNKLLQLTELIEFTEGNVGKNTSSVEFYTTITRIKELNKKSVFLASVLSIIIPGGGKYYLMQNSEATSTLALNIMAAAPVVECILRFGLISTASILSGLVFIPIYVAGVYGTIISKKTLIKKLNIQLKNEVLDYCTYQLHH